MPTSSHANPRPDTHIPLSTAAAAPDLHSDGCAQRGLAYQRLPPSLGGSGTRWRPNPPELTPAKDRPSARLLTLQRAGEQFRMSEGRRRRQ
eukprot:jgi/Tetstr1/422209/TSEL_013061.t1